MEIKVGMKNINFLNRKNSFFVSGNINGDELFDELEQAIKVTNDICVDNCFSDSIKDQVIYTFINKYKIFIDSIHVKNKMGNYMQMYIKRKKKSNPNDSGQSYSRLKESYGMEYYLEDCGGYDTFLKTNGEGLDARLQDVYHLVRPNRGEKILDIGCGRGELSYIIHLTGAETIGLDYSKEAIEIANRTYGSKKKENLKYLCQDIFELGCDSQFDKIVMADIVEHIEQPMLERLFEKCSKLLNDNGILVIHTAPNKDYYDFEYPKKRKEAKKNNLYLPENPRSYYEELMHINEQNPSSLENALNRTYSEVKVWTGGANEIAIKKTVEDTQKDNSIFAIACLRKGRILDHTEAYYLQLDGSKIGVELNAKTKKIKAKLGSEIVISIKVKNIGMQTLFSFGNSPVYLSYHILDLEQNVILWDNRRTHLNKPLNPGEELEVATCVDISNNLEVGNNYIIRISMVAEGRFWFHDLSSEFVKDIILEVV